MTDKDFIFHRVCLMTPLSELAPKVCSILPEITPVGWQEPNPIEVVPCSRQSIKCDAHVVHYYMGGLPALMQAVRQLQNNPEESVAFVTDGQVKKSTLSAHQGHVHPTEWTTPELGAWALTKIMLRTLGVLPSIKPQDIERYTYIHFPLSKMRLGLFVKNMVHKVWHLFASKNGVSQNDRWQCDAVRESLGFHKDLSKEIEQAGGEPTFIEAWRLIWSFDKAGIQRKQELWNELGIETEPLDHNELRAHTLLRDDIPLFGLKVVGDGKFFPGVDQKITAHLTKKYPGSFQMRQARVSKLYVDEQTSEPFAVHEVREDGTDKVVGIQSFYGSCGHNQVFKAGSKKPLWDEVPVSGVSSLWVCSVEKSELFKRFGVHEMADDVLVGRIKQFVGAANLTNLHTTVWNACVDGDMVHIVLRATQGANFNSEYADPDDLANMKANIEAFFIGSWKLIAAGSCTRKTTTPNIPEFKDHFIHGLSGIGLSFSGYSKK